MILKNEIVAICNKLYYNRESLTILHKNDNEKFNKKIRDVLESNFLHSITEKEINFFQQYFNDYWNMFISGPDVLPVCEFVNFDESAKINDCLTEKHRNFAIYVSEIMFLINVNPQYFGDKLHNLLMNFVKSVSTEQFDKSWDFNREDFGVGLLIVLALKKDLLQTKIEKIYVEIEKIDFMYIKQLLKTIKNNINTPTNINNEYSTHICSFPVENFEREKILEFVDKYDPK